MTARERVLQTLRHIKTDVAPYNISFTAPAREKMALYYRDPDFTDRIGNHIAMAGRKRAVEAESEPVQPGFWRDEFGVVWDRRVDPDIGVVFRHPVDEKNVATYTFPDATDRRYYAHIADFCRRERERFIQVGVGFSFFERAWTLVGMERLLTSFIQDPSFAETLLDRLTDWLLLVVREFGRHDEVDCIHFGDDWGQQHGLIMGPAHWRRYLKPRLARIYAEVKKHGKFVSIHSCGDIREVLPDLVEIGLDIFNPFQPEVMDVYEMKRLYGDKLTFYGGISLQRTLSFGTPAEVKSEVLERIERLGYNGGYIVAPCHSVTRDVPEANMDVLIKTLQSQ